MMFGEEDCGRLTLDGHLDLDGPRRSAPVPDASRFITPAR